MSVFRGANGVGPSIATEVAMKDNCEKVYIEDKAEVVSKNMKPKFDAFRFDLISDGYLYFDLFKDIDSLMRTAGFGKLSLFKEVSESYITSSFAVNNVAPIRVVHLFWDKLQSVEDLYSAVAVSIVWFMYQAV